MGMTVTASVPVDWADEKHSISRGARFIVASVNQKVDFLPGTYF